MGCGVEGHADWVNGLPNFPIKGTAGIKPSHPTIYRRTSLNEAQMTDSEIALLVENLKHSQTTYGWINRQNQDAVKAIEQLQAALRHSDERVLEMDWRPIDTAPKDNKRPLCIARFNDDGSLQSFDYDAIWKSESESWEIPEVYYYWASANGNVEEPTHWCFEPKGFSRLSEIDREVKE